MIKKSSIPALPVLTRSMPTPDRVKELNHEVQLVTIQFFLLVRDQKYEEALKIGELYLKFYPNNQSILQFCYFIKHNREERNPSIMQYSRWSMRRTITLIRTAIKNRRRERMMRMRLNPWPRWNHEPASSAKSPNPRPSAQTAQNPCS